MVILPNLLIQIDWDYHSIPVPFRTNVAKCLILRPKLSFLSETRHLRESNKVGLTYRMFEKLQESCYPKPCSMLDLNRRTK